MDAERRDDGHWHFKLGPIEKGIVALIAAGIVATAGIAYRKFDAQSETLAQLVTQGAVTNSRLSDLSQQLTDVPELRRQVVELKVRVDQQVNRDDQQDGAIKELRQLRGLR